MNVMRHSLLLDAVKTRLSVPSIAVHLHIENTTMAMNASGIRDTARVLHVSTNTVMTELKKRNLTSTR